MEDGLFAVYAVVLGLIAALLVLKIAVFFAGYNQETRYIRAEMRRAGSYGEYRYWRRELRCHYLCLLPFVTKRNVMKIYPVLFHRGKHTKKRDANDKIFHILAPSLIGAAICAVCLCGASWAWFSATTAAGTSKIQTAKYIVEVTAGSTDGSMAEITDANGIKTIHFAESGEYTVTITPCGTAKSGYCTVSFGGNDYYTGQLVSDSLKFRIKAENTDAATITPQWGTRAAESEQNKIENEALLNENTKE